MTNSYSCSVFLISLEAVDDACSHCDKEASCYYL